MTEPDAIVGQLRPIRLPATFAELGLHDALAAFALGILAALILLALVRPFLSRRVDPAAVAQARIAALVEAPPETRLLGLARLLADVDPQRRGARPEGLDAALYVRGTAIDIAALEARIVELAREGQPAREGRGGGR